MLTGRERVEVTKKKRKEVKRASDSDVNTSVGYGNTATVGH